MSFNDYKLAAIACCFLFFAMFLYWISLALPKNTWIVKLSQGLVLVSNLLLACTLSIRWIQEGYFPLSNLYESLIFLSWSISGIHLFLEWKTKSRLLGAISSPLLFFLTGFSSLTLPVEMQKALPLVPSLQSNWLMMHVSMMMVSYSILIIGSLLSIFYLAFSYLNSNGEKEKEIMVSNSNSPNLNVSQVFSSKLSLLQLTDTWSYRTIGLGFPFLTLGIISGAVWANEA